MKKTNLFIMLGIAMLLSACSSSNITGKAIQQEKQITIGIQNGPASTLIMVANDRGYFEKEGVRVKIELFTAGKFAMQAMLGNSLDMAATGDVPPTLAALNKNEFVILTQILEKTENEIRVVALKDKNITDAKEYFNSKKKKLGTSFGGGPEFFTSEFIKKHNITRIELVNIKPEDMPFALQSKSVDAVAIFEPFITFSEKKVNNTITFSDNEIYSELFVLNARKDWTENNKDSVKRILRALILASQFIESNPEESKQILMNYSKLDRQTVDSFWENFHFKPVLNSLLLEHLNSVAKWAVETGKTKPDAEIPDFNGFIDKKFMESLDKNLVTI